MKLYIFSNRVVKAKHEFLLWLSWLKRNALFKLGASEIFTHCTFKVWCNSSIR